MAFVALFDANVLYPGSLRDLVVRLGQTGLFRARWTEQILDEAFGAIVRNQPELEGRLVRTRELMNGAIDDVVVRGYEPLIAGLSLPDPDDRHVLAAAICAGAQVIVTNNIKDFPADRLAPFGIEAQTPDEFVLHLIDLAPGRIITVIDHQAAALKNPPMSVEALLTRLRTVGLPRSVAIIRQQLRSS